MPALELSFVSDYAGYRLDVSHLVADECDYAGSHLDVSCLVADECDYAGYRLDVSCLVADETFSPVMMLVRQQEEHLAH